MMRAKQATTFVILFFFSILALQCVQAGEADCQSYSGDPVEVEIIIPGNNAEVSGAVEVIARVPACYCQDRTTLLVDGKEYEEGHSFNVIDEDDGSFEYFVHYFNSNLYDNGEYELTVVDKHASYNTTVKVTINNTASTVKYPGSPFFLYPFNNTKVQGKVTITLMKQMCNCTYGPTVAVDDKDPVELTGGSWLLICGYNYDRYNYKLDTTKLSDGKHTITAGHGSDTAELVLMVDNTGYIGVDDDDDDIVVDDDDDDIVVDDDELDLDDDGMPDEWELRFFGNLSQAPYMDYDGDGFYNIDEYKNNRDPTEPWPNDELDPVDGDDEKESILDGPYRNVILAIPALVFAAILVILIIALKKTGKKDGPESDVDQ